MGGYTSKGSSSTPIHEAVLKLFDLEYGILGRCPCYEACAKVDVTPANCRPWFRGYPRYQRLYQQGNDCYRRLRQHYEAMGVLK